MPETSPTYSTTITITGQILGELGGIVCTPDGDICVEIPAGALQEDTNISITAVGPEIEIPGVLLLTPGARLEPDGQTFFKPVKVIIRPDIDSVSEVALLLADTSGQYEELANIERNEAAGTVSGELDHFSWLYPFLAHGRGATPWPRCDVEGRLGRPLFGTVGPGETVRVDVTAIPDPNWHTGTVWAGGGGSSDLLVLYFTFPTQVSGQRVCLASITMEDPGITGEGPNVQQQWRYKVFNRIFRDFQTTCHISGSDGIAVHPTRAVDIDWWHLPIGYPTGRARVDISYHDENGQRIDTCTLILAIKNSAF